MQLRIQPGPLSGTLKIPPSKSHTMRALVLALMAEGTSYIHNYLHSPDTFSMIEALKALGAKVHVNEFIEVEGTRNWQDAEIDAGNSGQVFRFIAAIASLSPTKTKISGDHSISQNRPIKPLIEALIQRGAKIELPCQIQGPITAGDFHLCGKDSQPVSALLMAASFLEGTSHIYAENPGEKPWIDLTLYWLKKLGIPIVNENYTHYVIPGKASYQGFEVTIPGDYSSAAFPYAASLLCGNITLLGLDPDDVQGDKKVLPLLTQMGGIIDANDFIDAVPLLAVMACFAKEKTEIVNAAIARTKESDRLSAITTELRKMGAHIEEKPDGLIIHPSPLQGATLDSHKDHRIALSLAIAALAANGPSHILDTACIAKSYPNFAQDFKSLGALIS